MVVFTHGRLKTNFNLSYEDRILKDELFVKIKLQTEFNNNNNNLNLIIITIICWNGRMTFNRFDYLGCFISSKTD